MDKHCYDQLQQDEQARLQLWLEVSSEMESHQDWKELDLKVQETVRKILRYVMVEGWSD